MNPDTRCCGSGHCIIDTEGHCWCGQRWDGERLCREPLAPAGVTAPGAADPLPPAGPLE